MGWVIVEQTPLDDVACEGGFLVSSGSLAFMNYLQIRIVISNYLSISSITKSLLSLHKFTKDIHAD